MVPRYRDAEKTLWDKRYCDASFYVLPWGRELIGTKYIECPECRSNLVYQTDRSNTDPNAMKGKCLGCRKEFTAEETLDIVLLGEFGESHMSYCLNCRLFSFICVDEICRCYSCGFSLEGTRCWACSESVVSEYGYIVHSELCEACA